MEVDLGALLMPPRDKIDISQHSLRVIDTANDRPDTDTLPVPSDPAADHLDPDLVARRADVEEKHRRVARFLDANGYDGLLLTRADSIAWFTSGGDLGAGLASEQGAVVLYVNRHSRAVLCDNVHSPRVFEEELAGLGFQLKERPWHEESSRIIAELGHAKRLAADAPLPPCDDLHSALRKVRLSLTRLERQYLRELGRTLALALEATCRNFQPGETESDVAGHLAHRLMREGVVPVDLRVAGDGRLARYRQPTFKGAEIGRRATITAVGRRHGLCAAATRTVTFGPAEPSFRASHGVAAMVDATCIYFSRPGESVAEVFRRARRIYEKFGHPDEWTLDYQGYLIGHHPCEVLLRPDTNLAFQVDMPVRWSPSVGSARSEDTVVVDDRGYEVVTEAQNWPKLEVIVKGFAMTRPGILER